MWLAGQAPGFAAYGIPAIAGTAIAGPAGGAAALGAVMGAGARGDIYQRETEQGIEPTSGQLAGAQAIGTVAGAAMDVAPGLAGKLPVNKLVGRALGVGTDAVTFGASSGVQEAYGQKIEIGAGKRDRYDPNAIIGAAVSGAEFGAPFGALPKGHGAKAVEEGGAKDQAGTATGGEIKSGRYKPPPGVDTKERATTTTTPDAQKTGPPPGESPVSDPAVAQALGAKPPEPPPTVERAVEPAPAEAAVSEAPAGEAPPEAKAAEGAQGAVSDTQATLAQQHAELLDPAHPREAMLYPPGVPVLALPEGRQFGQVRLPDGSKVQFDRKGPNQLTQADVRKIAKAGNLDDLITPKPREQPVAGREQPVAAEAPPPEGTPATAAAGTAEAPAPAPSIAEQIAARKAEVDAALRREGISTEGPPPAAPPAAPPEKPPSPPPPPPPSRSAEAAELVRNQAEFLKQREADRQAQAAAAEEALRKQREAEKAAKIAELNEKLRRGEPSTPGVSVEKDEDPEVRAAREAQAARRAAAAAAPAEAPTEKKLSASERFAAKRAELKAAGERAAAAPKPAEAPPLKVEPRVIHEAVSEAERHAQAVAEREAQEKALAAQSAAAKPKGKRGQTGKTIKEKDEQKPGRISPKDADERRKNNAIANEIMARPEFAPKNEEGMAAVQGMRGEGADARTMVRERAKAIVEAATKAGYGFMSIVKDRKDPELKHNNMAVLLHEAKRLTDNKLPKVPDYATFMRNEDELLHNGEEGYYNVLKDRSQSGAIRAKELKRPTKEMAAETIAPKTLAKAEAEATGTETTEERQEREKAEAEIEQEKAEAGEARPMTENERRALEASERARARLAEQEKGPQERETPRVKEGEGYAAITERKAPVVEKIRRRVIAKAQGLAKYRPMGKLDFDFDMLRGMHPDEIARYLDRPLTEDERDSAVKDHADLLKEVKRSMDEQEEDDKRARNPNAVETVDAFGRKTHVISQKSMSVREALIQHIDYSKYSPILRPMIRTLAAALDRIVGDLPVHWISDEDMTRIENEDTYGVYKHKRDGIFINADQAPHDTVLHEIFHAATAKAVAVDEALRNQIAGIGREVMAQMPLIKDIPLHQLDDMQYALTSPDEFITGVMTNENVQSILKRMKISDRLARELELPKWRKNTIWNGLVQALLNKFGLGFKGHSAIEAVMAVSERAMGARLEQRARWGEVKGLERGESLAKRKLAPEEREKAQEAFIRSPREAIEHLSNFEPKMMKQIGGDLKTNTSAAFMRGHLKALAGNWIEEFHGKLFNDSKGRIIQAINSARDKIGSTYEKLRQLDRDHITRGYLLDRKYYDQMQNYNELVAKSVRYNIHADQDRPALAKGQKQPALRHVQQHQFYDEVRELYDQLPDELKARYTSEKQFYMDKQKQFAQTILENTLPLFGADNAMIKRAIDRDLTDDDWKKIEDWGAERYIRKAYQMGDRKQVYFNSQRRGNYVVTGRYDMPAGGADTGHDSEELPDHVREFDTEDEARDFAKDTQLPASIHQVQYHEEAGAINRVPVGQAVSTGKVVKKYQVALERQHTQFAESRADAERLRAEMMKAGVKELSGVMDRRQDSAWAKINSAEQKAIERRINSQSHLTDDQKSNLKELTRQWMLAGQNSFTPHLMQSRKIFGADYSTGAGLDEYSRSINQHISRASHRAELDDAMDRLEKHTDKMSVDDPDNAYRRSVIRNEMNQRAYGGDMMQSKVNPLLHKLMTWAFTNFLVRPSHIFLHQLHPYIYSIPELAGRHGYWASLQAHRQAMADLGGQMHNLWDGVQDSRNMLRSLREGDTEKAIQLARGADPARRMIERLKDADDRRDLLAMMDTGHLHSMYDASMFEGQGLDRWNAVMRQFTNQMEANNRLATALASLRLERKMHPDNAVSYARQVIERTQGMYTPSNIAPLFKNPILRPFLQFRQMPTNLAINLYRNAANSLESGAEGVEARRSLAYQLATAGALGGVGAMPTFPLKMVGLAGAAVGGPLPEDYDDTAQRYVASIIGPTAMKTLWYGLPGMAGPYGPSLGSRIGVNPDFLFGDPASGKPADIVGYLAQNFIGATGSLAENVAQGLQDLESGNYTKAASNVLPGSLRDFAIARSKIEGAGPTKPGSYADGLLHIAGFSSVADVERAEGTTVLRRRMQAERAAAPKSLKQSREGQILGMKMKPKDLRKYGDYSIYQ